MQTLLSYQCAKNANGLMDRQADRQTAIQLYIVNNSKLFIYSPSQLFF